MIGKAEVVPDSLSTVATTASADTTPSPWGLDVYLMSRYVWRGVQFGTGPSIQAQLGYTEGGFMAACYVAKSMNGTSTGFPNTSNVMVGYQYHGVSLFVDDYYFYDEDNLDRYFDWSDTTLHYVETRLRYDGARCYGMVSYNIYAGDGAKKAPYVEGGYRFPKHRLTLFAGYLFDESDLNFSTSAGVTNIGLTKEKDIRINKGFALPLTGSLIVNPNYKNVVDLPGVVRSALTLVVGVHF